MAFAGAFVPEATLEKANIFAYRAQLRRKEEDESRKNRLYAPVPSMRPHVTRTIVSMTNPGVQHCDGLIVFELCVQAITT